MSPYTLFHSLLHSCAEDIRGLFRFAPRASRFQRGYNYAIEQRLLGKTDEQLSVEADGAFDFNDFDRGILAAIELNNVKPADANLPPSV